MKKIRSSFCGFPLWCLCLWLNIETLRAQIQTNTQTNALRAHDGPLICLEKEAGNDSMCYARQAAPSVGIRINRDSASRRFRSNTMQKYSFDDMTKKQTTTNPREINKMSPTVFTCRRVTSQTGPADSHVWPNEDAVRLADSARQ